MRLVRTTSPHSYRGGFDNNLHSLFSLEAARSEVINFSYAFKSDANNFGHSNSLKNYPASIPQRADIAAAVFTLLSHWRAALHSASAQPVHGGTTFFDSTQRREGNSGKPNAVALGVKAQYAAVTHDFVGHRKNFFNFFTIVADIIKRL
jgi:hypothetical protein